MSQALAHAPGAASASRSRLRVATLNAWGMRGEWPARRQALRAGFKEMAADVITLQEVIRTDRYDQAREILGEGYHIAWQRQREADGQGVATASRWPVREVTEVDLHVTGRTSDFACTSLIAEIDAPAPVGRLWLVNHLPNWQLGHEHEREMQAVTAATAIERLLADRPGHVVVAGDFDAEPEAASVRFWTGRQSLQGMSVCYRDAWAALHPGDPGPTFVPDNPYAADWDWPFRRIDYIMIRCGAHGGPTLAAAACERTFAGPGEVVSDHYGVVADLQLPRPEHNPG